MKEHRRIVPGIEQYVFSLKDHGLAFDLNVTVLIDKDKALLIDVGYREQAQVVKEVLEKRGIQIDTIILSHYHPDHAAGASVFPNATLYCSKDYETNYRNCSEVWDVENDYKPADKILYSGEGLKFGDFELRAFDTPGHCVCGLSVVINETYIHVGDLIMNDDTENPALPMICDDGGVREHVQSLEWLKKHANKIVLLPHGKSLTSKEDVNYAIEIRVNYLKSLIEFYDMWHDEVYQQNHLEGWACPKSHKGNMRQVQKIIL